MRRWILFTVAAALASLAWGQPERPIRIDKREKKEPLTQALEAVPDPPAAIAGETAKLVFHVSPLSGKGLLSQQIRDALKAIDKANAGATLIKVRAFVAGNGDLRRVQQIVSEDFSEKRRPLPAVSTVQVGGLPLEGAQVVIEAVSLDKKAVNPNGLGFFSGARTANLTDAIQQLQEAASKASATMMRTTCFVHSLDGAAAARQQIAAAFSGAAVNLVQLTRLGVEPLALCEGVGRLTAAPAQAVSLQPGAALVKASSIVFTGIQMAFRREEADLRLMFERSRKTVEGVKGSDIVFASIYALNRTTADRMPALMKDTLGQGAMTGLIIEGLPSLDAAVAVEVIAVVR